MSDKATLFLQHPDLISAMEAEEIAFRVAAKGEAESANWDTIRNANKAQDWFASLADFIWHLRRVEYAEFRRPAEVLARAEQVFRHLSEGSAPIPVRLATKGKGNAALPGERRDVAFAIFYILAVRTGEIDDPHPNKTVRELYGVEAQTVRRWLTKEEHYCQEITAPEPGFLLEEIRRRGPRYKQNRTGRKSAPE